MISLTALVIAFVIFLITYHVWKINTRCYKMVEKLHGEGEPKVLPIIGNAHLFSPDSLVNYQLLVKFSKLHKRLFRLWLGNSAFVFGYTPEDAETILSSTSHIAKSDAYLYAMPWIGTGLLTSAGPKWKSRRRIITPTFHFKILENFVQVFEDNSKVLIAKLMENAGKDSFDVYPYCNLFALDNICDSAMGVHINAQMDANSEYVSSVKAMCKIINVRVYQPWLANDLVFKLSKYGGIQKRALKVLHGVTTRTIQERRQLFKEKTEDIVDSEEYGKKKLAFLDLLLESADAANLTDDDIREEVDTFMFEGHDTITSGLSFAIYCLSQNPGAQEEAYKEQFEIFGDSDRAATTKDYQEMKYLDRVLKESQRLYPSVPIIGRRIHEDLKLSDGLILPKGIQFHTILTVLHRNPDQWKDPESFNPDNFLPEVSIKRNPYAYVPFSAGPRNCIGQKFAFLEMKVCLSAVLRNFKLLPCREDEKAIPLAEIVLVSRNGINVRLVSRKEN